MPLERPPTFDAPVLSQFSLKGKICAITGGARGIGAEVVRGLAEAGADVAIIYNTSSTAAEQLATQVSKETGSKIKVYKGNVTSRNEISGVVDQIVAEFGRLDVMIANSGMAGNTPSLNYTEETWRNVTSVNLDGVMWTAQAAGKVFQKQGKGNLIITASVSATLVNIPQTQAAYNASKAAAVHLAQSLAVEWVDFARVNSVSPGYIVTEMTHAPPEIEHKWLSMIPAKRMAHPAELKGLYVFLASDACPYMTGSDLICDGGYTLT